MPKCSIKARSSIRKQNFISLIKEKSELSDFICDVKTPNYVKIKSGTVSHIKCRVKVPMDERQKVVSVIPDNDRVYSGNDDDIYFSERGKPITFMLMLRILQKMIIS